MLKISCHSIFRGMEYKLYWPFGMVSPPILILSPKAMMVNRNVQGIHGRNIYLPTTTIWVERHAEYTYIILRHPYNSPISLNPRSIGTRTYHGPNQYKSHLSNLAG